MGRCDVIINRKRVTGGSLTSTWNDDPLPFRLLLSQNSAYQLARDRDTMRFAVQFIYNSKSLICINDTYFFITKFIAYGFMNRTSDSRFKITDSNQIFAHRARFFLM